MACTFAAISATGRCHTAHRRARRANMAIYNNLVISLCLQQGSNKLPRRGVCFLLNQYFPWCS